MKKEEIETQILTCFFALRDLGADYLVLNYSGGGDSGCIEELELYDANEISWDTIGEHKDYGLPMEGILSIDFNDEHVDPIKDWAQDTILNEIEDWWNNDGGFGILAIDLHTGIYICNNNTYRTETDLWEHEGNIKDVSGHANKIGKYGASV